MVSVAEFFTPVPEGEYRAYAGIGSRETPEDVCDLMTRIASELEKRGYRLRSGGAPGADSSFAAGVRYLKNKSIYLPWTGFNYPEAGLYGHVVTDFSNFDQALLLAEKFHPGWKNCKSGARKMHARNMYQALGRHLNDPAYAVICWTRGGKVVGGTGQALRVAADPTYDIPVYNLFHDEFRRQFEDLLSRSAQ